MIHAPGTNNRGCEALADRSIHAPDLASAAGDKIDAIVESIDIFPTPGETDNIADKLPKVCAELELQLDARYPAGRT